MNVSHQSEQRERASNWGIAFLIGVIKRTGPGFVKILVVPVALYYFLTSPSAREVSYKYLSHLQQVGKNKGIPVELPDRPLSWLSFMHILSFARSMVDRVHSWLAGVEAVRYQIEGRELLDQVLTDDQHGALFLVSHLGNFDLAIAHSTVTPQKRFNIVLDTSQTRTYNRFRDKNFISAQVRFIEPNRINPITIIKLVEQVANGEIVVIAADRTLNANHKNSVPADFLGDQAAFPSGPYIMAHLLKVPVYSLFALKRHDGCLVKFELFAPRIILPSKQKRSEIKRYAQNYASRLERECLRFPLQWYNFYDFWARPESLTRERHDQSS